MFIKIESMNLIKRFVDKMNKQIEIQTLLLISSIGHHLNDKLAYKPLSNSCISSQCKSYKLSFITISR